DDRHARCLRFDDDVAEGVSGAWKGEDVSRGVGGGEFEAGEITGEDCIRESFGKRLRVRSMPDDEKLDRQSLLAETAVCVCQNIEIFLARNPADIEQAHFAVRGRAIFFTKRRVA